MHELLDTLMYRSEGTELDFKAEQYEISSGSIEKKSELVKDILAMANAWRDGPGYILIGVKENKPEPPQIIGITDLHDDAHFQQIVNSKVTPKIEFSYEVASYRGKIVGLITIPKQKRPFYLPKAWGKVMAETVYIRRGSSTATALPDEVAKMGIANERSRDKPKVFVYLKSKNGTEISGTAQKLTRLNFGDISKLPDFGYTRPSNQFYSIALANPLTNKSYWRDLAEYLHAHSSCLTVDITIKNTSEFSISDCKLEIDASMSDGSRPLVLLDYKLPSKPSTDIGVLPPIRPLRTGSSSDRPSLKIEKLSGDLRCVARFPKILPGETASLENSVVYFPQNSGNLKFSSRLLANELKIPKLFEDSVEITLESKDLTIDDLSNIHANGY